MAKSTERVMKGREVDLHLVCFELEAYVDVFHPGLHRLEANCEVPYKVIERFQPMVWLGPGEGLQHLKPEMRVSCSAALPAGSRPSSCQAAHCHCPLSVSGWFQNENRQTVHRRTAFPSALYSFTQERVIGSVIHEINQNPHCPAMKKEKENVVRVIQFTLCTIWLVCEVVLYYKKNLPACYYMTNATSNHFMCIYIYIYIYIYILKKQMFLQRHSVNAAHDNTGDSPCIAKWSFCVFPTEGDHVCFWPAPRSPTDRLSCAVALLQGGPSGPRTGPGQAVPSPLLFGWRWWVDGGRLQWPGGWCGPAGLPE